jgi:primary-amine oxidase
MHEEDTGILWKHTNLEGRSDVRRSRRFVVSYFSTIGNYDYGFYWNFGLDGTIEVEAKATGIVFVGAGSRRPQRHATELAPACSRPCTSTCSARGSTSRSTATTTASSRSTPRACRWAGEPFGNAFS